MSFAGYGFDMRLLSGIRAAGYDKPTPVQSGVMPSVLKGLDVMGLARTGTGKTAAFVLPLLQRLLADNADKRGPVRVLVLEPTRELAMQTHETFFTLGRQTGIRCAAVYGGAGLVGQAREVKKVTVVTACPGRLLDLMQRGEIDLSSVQILVLDEADRMLDMGFMTDVRKIFEHLPQNRQNLMFSATMPDEIAEVAGDILNEPEIVRIDRTAAAVNVEQMCCPVPLHLKQDFLQQLLKGIDFQRVLVFVRTKRWARRLAQRLARSGFKAIDLHGDLSPGRRKKALEGFREGGFTIMVATDLASRGLDCSGISHVVNYDMPDTAEIYIHRIGRTGRAERDGVAYLFSAPEERDKLVEIEQVLGYSLPVHYLDDFNYDAAVSDFSTSNKKSASAQRGDFPQIKSGRRPRK